MSCSACGKQLDGGSAFCFSCGAPVAQVAPRSKSNPVVIIVVVVVALFGVIALGGIVAALVIPRVSIERIGAKEMYAIQNIRSINTAQVQYFSQYDRYAGSLSELGPPANGPAGPSSADLLPANLAAGAKSGYIYTLQHSPTGYTLNANPVKYGSTGRRTFFSDESLVIRANWGPEPATAASGELN